LTCLFPKLVQFERAIQDYDEAFHLDPGNAVAYSAKELTHRLPGKKTEAIADFEKCITLADIPQINEQAK